MSSRIKLSNSQRRQIRQLVREEFRRKQVISEHMSVIHDKALLYESRASASGLTQEQINTGILNIINEESKTLNEFSLGGISGSEVAFDMIKKYLAGMVLNYFGLDEQEDSIIFSLLQNIFEAIDYTRCDEMMRVLTEAITETVTELGGEALIKYVAGKALPDSISGIVDGVLDSVLADAAGEGLNQRVVEVVQGVLQEPMREFICNGKLVDILTGGSGGSGGIFDAIGGIFSGMFGGSEN
jgi:hypothetical protein